MVCVFFPHFQSHVLQRINAYAGEWKKRSEARAEAPSKHINASGFQDFCYLLPIFPPSELNPESQVEVQKGESIGKGQSR